MKVIHVSRFKLPTYYLSISQGEGDLDFSQSEQRCRDIGKGYWNKYKSSLHTCLGIKTHHKIKKK